MKYLRAAKQARPLPAQVRGKVKEHLLKKGRKSSIEPMKLSDALQLIEPKKSSSKHLVLQTSANKSLNASMHARRASQIHQSSKQMIMITDAQSLKDQRT